MSPFSKKLLALFIAGCTQVAQAHTVPVSLSSLDEKELAFVCAYQINEMAWAGFNAPPQKNQVDTVIRALLIRNEWLHNAAGISLEQVEHLRKRASQAEAFREQAVYCWKTGSARLEALPDTVKKARGHEALEDLKKMADR